MFSTFGRAQSGLYLEVNTNKGDQEYLKFGDFTLKGKDFYFNGKSVCIKGSQEQKTTECPFQLDHFIKNDQNSIFVAIHSMNRSAASYQIKMDESFHVLDLTYCYSEKTNCRFHFYEANNTPPKVIDIDNKLLLSYLLIKDKLPLVSLPEIPANAGLMLPAEFMEDGGSIYYQLKGPVLIISSYSDDEWGPYYYKKSDLKERVQIDETARIWDRTTANNNSRNVNLDIAFQKIDPDLKWMEVIATPNVFLDLKICSHESIVCFFTYYDKTIDEQKKESLKRVQQYKLSPFMNKFIEELLPCLEKKDHECIKDFFVSEQDLKNFDDESGCYDESFSFPQYSFKPEDIDELKECLKYENLRADLTSSIGKNRVCAFAPRYYLKKNKLKLIGLISSSLVKESYKNYDYEQIYPTHDWSSRYSGDALSYFGVLGKIASEKIAQEIKYPDAQNELADRSSLLINNLKNSDYLFPGVVNKLAKKNYKFDYFFPKIAEREDVKPLVKQFNEFYKDNMKSFLKQKMIHPDFFKDESFNDNYFKYRCAQDDLDVSHLDNDKNIISLKGIFVEGIKKLNKNINTQCVPLAIRVSPDFLVKIKDHPDWFHLFIPSKFYTANYFKRKYKTRSFYNHDDFKEPLGVLSFNPLEKGVVTSFDFQSNMFEKMPWVIKYLENDFSFSEEALLKGLSMHYSPQRFFTEKQLANNTIKNFLMKKKSLSKEDYEKYLLEIDLNLMGNDIFFEIMDPYLYSNDEFQILRGQNAILRRRQISDRVDTRYLVVLAENTELTPKLRDVVLASCREGSDSSHTSKFLYFPWSKKFPEFMTELKECLNASAAKYNR